MSKWTPKGRIEGLVKVLEEGVSGSGTTAELLRKVLEMRRHHTITGAGYAGLGVGLRYGAVDQLIDMVNDTDRIKEALATHVSLTVDPSMYETACARLESVEACSDNWLIFRTVPVRVSYKGAVYNFGSAAIKIRPRINGAGSPALLVNFRRKNTTRTSHYHPHVRSGGEPCFGTWNGLVQRRLQDPKLVLMLALEVWEFLQVYNPSSPFVRLAYGFPSNFESGNPLCEGTDRPRSKCDCSRCYSGVPCPKTQDRITSIPFEDYCDGCKFYARTENVCTHSFSMDAKSWRKARLEGLIVNEREVQTQLAMQQHNQRIAEQAGRERAALEQGGVESRGESQAARNLQESLTEYLNRQRQLSQEAMTEQERMAREQSNLMQQYWRTALEPGIQQLNPTNWGIVETTGAGSSTAGLPPTPPPVPVPEVPGETAYSGYDEDDDYDDDEDEEA